MLELGCGEGVFLGAFGPGSVGVDRDADCVARLRARGLDARVRDLDEPGWSAGLGRFDHVWAVDLLMHLERPEVCLRELPNVLAPGGTLALCEWLLPEHGLGRRLARRVPGAGAVWDHPEHLRHYTRSSLDAALRDAGLRVREAYLHSFEGGLARAAVGWFWPPRTLIAEVDGPTMERGAPGGPAR